MEARRGPGITREIPLAIEGEPAIAETPWVTYLLILANVVVYIITSHQSFFISSSDAWIARLGFIPLGLLSDPSHVVRIFTSMFTHANIIHIFFNMYFLYLFGRAVEKSLGHLRYFALYMISGVMATITHTVFMMIFSPSGLSIPSIGASGAISGVLGAYLLMYPGTRLAACFFLFIFPLCFELPSAAWILFWFGLQVLEGFYLAASSAVAFFAHVGGFITGIALVPALANREKIDSLRALAGAKKLFGFIVFLPFPRLRRGLNPLVKAVLLGLISMTLMGALAGVFYPPHSFMTASYSVNWMGGGSEHAYLGVLNGGHILTAGDTVDSKVLLDVLAHSRLLYNPSLAGKVLLEYSAGPSRLPLYLGPHYIVTIVYTLHVYNAVYNKIGLLERALATSTIMTPQGNGVLNARLKLLGHYNGLYIFEAFDLAVLAAITASMITVAFRDVDYVITPE